MVWDLGNKTKQVLSIEQVSQWLGGKMLTLQWKCRGSNPLGFIFLVSKRGGKDCISYESINIFISCFDGLAVEWRLLNEWIRNPVLWLMPFFLRLGTDLKTIHLSHGCHIGLVVELSTNDGWTGVQILPWLIFWAKKNWKIKSINSK